MTQVTERRRGLRVGVDKGLVFLRSSGVPSIACALTDLSAEGFSCLAPLHTLDAETGERWKSILTNVGHLMSVDISSPPALPGIHLEDEVRYHRQGGNGLTVGFRFHALDSRDANTLKQALPNMFRPVPEEKTAKPENHFEPKRALSNGKSHAYVAP